MTEQGNDLLLVDRADGVATVTLNRPEARNALNVELLRALPATIAELDADDEVAVVILTGADPAFCAGLDLKQLGSSGDNLSGGGQGVAATPFPDDMVKPVIGAVNGPAVTGGLELALHCDFLIASERARFGDTHARVGVVPGWGLSVLLPQAVGVRRAKEMSLTGRFLTAQDALACWAGEPRGAPPRALAHGTRARGRHRRRRAGRGARAPRRVQADIRHDCHRGPRDRGPPLP